MTAHALRLVPGEDLKRRLVAFATTHDFQAACLLTCVGSLTDVHLRFANQNQGTRLQGHFEIVSLVGTLGPNGAHLHLSVADETGHTLGGHLLDGNLIYTTAEIVVGELPTTRFLRQLDERTGYPELVVGPR